MMTTRRGRMMAASRLASVLVSALLLGACQSDSTTAPGIPAPVSARHPATIELPDPAMELGLGNSRRLRAVLRDADGQPLPAPQLEWITGDSTVVRVTPGGLLTAVAPGSATITVRHGALSASMQVQVKAHVEGTAYTVTSVDGRPLPAIVDIERLTLDDGRVVDILTRLESGIVYLEDRYEVVLQLVGIEREEIDGRQVHREIGRTIEYDRGQATWNFLNATALLESTYIGGLTHHFLPSGRGPGIRYRLSGSTTTLQLGLTLQPSLRP